MTAFESKPTEPRAPLAARDDWRLASVDELASQLAGQHELPETLAHSLARAWADTALEAHAAIGAYARFTLQLMSLGAPPRLINGAAQAMQDEVAHAQACFSLARHYAGREIGPGPLSSALHPRESDLTSTVLSVVQRGCIQEAVEALSAREALEHCQDAAPREVLVSRQELKAQQAQLAWRFVAWALRSTRQNGGRELADHVRVTFVTALEPPSHAYALSERDRLLLRHGVLSGSQRVALRQRVLRDVVLPCMEALLSRVTAREGYRSAPIRASTNGA
jgi:hypothetical protein